MSIPNGSYGRATKGYCRLTRSNARSRFLVTSCCRATGSSRGDHCALLFKVLSRLFCRRDHQGGSLFVVVCDFACCASPERRPRIGNAPTCDPTALGNALPASTRFDDHEPAACNRRLRFPLSYHPLGSFHPLDRPPDIVEPGEHSCKKKLASFDRIVDSGRDEQRLLRQA